MKPENSREVLNLLSSFGTYSTRICTYTVFVTPADFPKSLRGIFKDLFSRHNRGRHVVVEMTRTERYENAKSYDRARKRC